MNAGIPDLEEIRDEGSRRRVATAYDALCSCTVCPRECGVDRFSGETGSCRTGLLARVSSANLHFGEEPPLSGTRGSGTVFFAWCNLACDYCQNFPISQSGYGREIRPGALAGLFLSLERRGAHNINLVTPGHVVPQVLHALVLAKEGGLSLPVVYNSNGYDQPAMLDLLEGFVDIYLPDMKYSDDRLALRHSKVRGYVEANRRAVGIMARQVGPLELDGDGIARKGLLIRHLLLPSGLSGFPETARHIRAELGSGTPVSFMAQYFPAHRASRIGGLDRKITGREYEEGLAVLFSEGLLEGYVQDRDEDLPSDPSTQERSCQEEKISATF